MKLLLDSAKTEEIRHGLDLWDLDGVTTNPRHVMVSGKPFRQVIGEIAQMVAGTDKEISVEVNPHHTDWEKIVAEGKELAALSPNFVIKVGISESGCKAVRELAAAGVRVNATLIHTVAQAWHAARAGAAFVSPFLGWKDQFGDDSTTFIREVKTMLDANGYGAKIIAAALRNPKQMGEAAMAGAHYVTANFAIYQDSFANPYTVHGEKIFQNSWDATPGGE